MIANKTKIIQSTIAPNPNEASQWVDLSADPYGKVVKVFDGTKWVQNNDETGKVEQLRSTLTKQINTVKESVDANTAGVEKLNTTFNTTVESLNQTNAAQDKKINKNVDDIAAAVTRISTNEVNIKELQRGGNTYVFTEEDLPQNITFPVNNNVVGTYTAEQFDKIKALCEKYIILVYNGIPFIKGTVSEYGLTLTAWEGYVPYRVYYLRWTGGTTDGSRVYTLQANMRDLVASDQLEFVQMIAQANRQSITTINTKIAKLQSDVTTAKGNIATLTTDMSTAKTDITTVKSDIATLKTDVSTAKGNITTITSDVNTVKTNITALQSKDTELKGLIDTNTTSIADLIKRVTALENAGKTTA